MYGQGSLRLIHLSSFALSLFMLPAFGKGLTVEGLFRNAAKSAAAQSSVPVYIPASLQSLDADAKDGCVFAQATADSFDLAIYGRVTEYGKSQPLPCEANDAAFLAEIHGDSKPMPDLSKDRRAQKVMLASGFVGWFIPVSCGGSCSPATLYWQTRKGSYWLQLKLGPESSESEQRARLLATANSLVTVTADR